MKRLFSVIFVLALLVVGFFVQAPSVSAAPAASCRYYDHKYSVRNPGGTAHTAAIEVTNTRVKPYGYICINTATYVSHVYGGIVCRVWTFRPYTSTLRKCLPYSNGTGVGRDGTGYLYFLTQYHVSGPNRQSWSCTQLMAIYVNWSWSSWNPSCKRP